jgi:streptomycin 6-kinase
MDHIVTIRRARPQDAAHLPAVEKSAGEAFRVLADLAWIASDRVVEAASYAEPIREGTVWLAESNGRIVGVLLAESAGDVLHITELAVVRDAQQRGIGRKLLDAATAFARVKGLSAVTLTTFRHVAWNAPFYARYGFALLDNPDARLQTHLREETERGLPNRCAMRLAVAPLDFDVRDVVRKRVILEDQTMWLAGLGGLVDELAKTWQLRIGTVLSGGTEAVVIEADTADGERCVLKLCLPGADPMHNEMRVLAHAAGRGYARLLRHDTGRNVMLLERLDRQLHELDLSSDAKLEAICGTLTRAWLPCPMGERFTNGIEKADSLVEIIERLWSALGKPCDERTVDMALSFAKTRRRAFDPRHAVLAHGDGHEWNTLVAGDSFKFVDPDGIFVEPAYDLAISMRENADELLAGDPVALGRRRCRMLATLTGLDETAIWEWGFLERVSNSLLCAQIDKDGAVAMLAVADAWSAAG